MGDKIRAFSGVFAASLLLAGCGGGGGGAKGLFGGGGRSVNVALATEGARGAVPVIVNDDVTFVDGSGKGVSAPENGSLRVAAPEGYADRRFVAWRQGAQDVAVTPSASLDASDLAANGTARAVYVPRSMPAGGFTPAFGKPDFPRWKQFPVRVYLDGLSGDDTGRVRTGLDRWVAASGGVVSYQLVGDAAQAQITVKFGALPGGAAGRCDTLWDGRKNLTSATITLNPPRAGFGQQSGQNVETLAAHEFGHALGMSGPEGNEGHSDDRKDTMYPYANSLVGVITERDMNTLANIYPTLFGGASRSVSLTDAASDGAGGSATSVCH